MATVSVHACRRVASHVSTPCSRRNVHAATTNAPAISMTRVLQVSAVVAGMVPVTSVKPRAFFSSTAGLRSVRAPTRVAPFPRATINSCRGTTAAYASRMPMPVAAGAAMLRPMKRTPISVPMAILATRIPGVHSRNFRSSIGSGT